MNDYRTHFYGQYTSVQQRTESLDDLKVRARDEAKLVQRDIVPHLPADRSARILDLGCGYGGFLLALQNLGYQHVRGIDISEQQVASARALGVVDVHVGDATSAFAGPDRWDAIVLLDVIEHLTRNEAIATLRQCLDHLTEHGVLILRTPNIDAALGTVLSFGDLTHELHLNKLSALELFASLGVETVDVLPSPPHGGSAIVRALRAVITPVIAIRERLQALAAGISRAHYLRTVNMVIVARRSRRS